MPDIDELLSIWEQRRESGTELSPEELCGDCPEQISEVRQQIRALRAVESFFGGTFSGDGLATESNAERVGNLVDSELKVLSELRIERLHASGGLGDVFVALDPVLNRRVAVKFPRAERMSVEQRARFEREARITGRLDHPGIVPVHALRQDDDGQPCYVMRFVEGPTLQETIRQWHQTVGDNPTRSQYDSLPFRQLLQNLIAVSNIVAYAHGQGVIHRDIKPANIILGPFGETMLLDWGLAKTLNEPEQETEHSAGIEIRKEGDTLVGQVMGTPAFASPEQLLGQSDLIDHRADIYALGATLFFLFTGKYPVDPQNAIHRLHRNPHQRPSPRDHHSAIPKELDAICRRALAKDPNDRYPTTSELTEDLERFLAGEPVSVLRDSLWTQWGRYLGRRPRLVAATLATILMTIVGSLLGTTLLNQKNRELVRSNDRLARAISESQLANQQTLFALRSMVDDVVVRDLGEGIIPDAEERRFLEQILNQYEALASIQGDEPTSVAIRAEGLGQTGRILLRLADESEALVKLRESVRQFQNLVNKTGDASHCLQLARAKGDLSEALQRVGQLEEGFQEASGAIQILAAKGVDHNDQTVRMAHSSLYRILAAVQQRRLDWAAADKSLSMAQSGFEELVKIQPQDKSLRQSLAAVYRMQGENSHWLGDVARQGKSLNLAIRTQRDLVKQFPDRSEHELGLALALNSLSRHREFEGQITLAIGEVNEAIELSTRLSKQYPNATQYRQTLASLHHRRGNLRRIHGQPVIADADFHEAIVLWAALVIEQPDIPEYQSEGQAAQLDLASLKLETRRLDLAEQLLDELINRCNRFDQQFPEIAARSMILPISKIQLVRVQRRSAVGNSDLQTLDEAIQKLHDIANHDRSGLPQYWMAYARLEKVAILRSLGSKGVKTPDNIGKVDPRSSTETLKRLSTPSECLDQAAEEVRRLTESQKGNHEVLNKVAGLHREIAMLYEGLKQPELANFHREREMTLRTEIVNAFPDNPYYRVLLARAWMGQAPGLAAEKNEPEAIRRLTVASDVLQEAVDHYPGDQLVLSTMGDLRTREGRVLFAAKKFREADSKFSEAVRLNPSFENRASHTHNLAWFQPEAVLEKIDGILAEGIPDNFPLLTLLRACSIAANAQPGTSAADELARRAERILQHMVDEKYSPTGTFLRELRIAGQYRSFRQREKFSDLLATLENHRLDRASPQFVRSLPEPFRPTARWLMDRTLLDTNPAILIYQALGGRVR